jgi:hypothetical protein
MLNISEIEKITKWKGTFYETKLDILDTTWGEILPIIRP